VINLTPTGDFVGALEATNRQMVVIIVVLIALELLLMYFVSARLERPIETVSRELKAVESLSFVGPPTRSPALAGRTDRKAETTSISSLKRRAPRPLTELRLPRLQRILTSARDSHATAGKQLQSTITESV
jgi:hypothetical protein